MFTRNLNFRFYTSSTPGEVPTLLSNYFGRVWLNTADGIIYSSKYVNNELTLVVNYLNSYSPVAQQELTDVGGAVNLTSLLTYISSDADGSAFTLAVGTRIGQRKKIVMRTKGAGVATVTGAFAGTANTLTFDHAGEYALLEWDGTDWIALELASLLDVTNAPALTTV